MILKRVRTAFVLGLLCSSLSACFLPRNDVSPIQEGEIFWVGAQRAIVVVGVGFEGTWPRRGFSMTIDEAVGSIQPAESCWRRNQIEITIVPIRPGTRYFAFSVSPDIYVLPGWPDFPSGGERMDYSIVAKAGRAVYVGDFVFNQAGKWELRQNIDAARKNTAPIFNGHYTLEVAERGGPAP